MIALYRIGEGGSRPPGLGPETWPAPDWNAFLLRAGRAECAVLVWGEAGAVEAVARVREFRAEHPSVPLVLYGADAATVRDTARLADVIVPLGEGAPGLRRAVRQVSRHGLRDLSRRLRTAGGIDPRLRAVLHLCLAAPVPYAAVQDLARAAGLSVATVERYWREQWDGSPPLRLQDLLAWILLLRGYLAKHPANTWSGIAARLGTTARRLRAISKRWGLGTLTALESVPNEALWARFDREVCRTALGVSLATRSDRSA